MNDTYISHFVECSRISATLNELIDAEHRQYSSRCLDNGAFDPLQCINDKCLCVNSTTAAATSKVYTVGGVTGMQLHEMTCCKWNAIVWAVVAVISIVAIYLCKLLLLWHTCAPLTAAALLSILTLSQVYPLTSIWVDCGAVHTENTFNSFANGKLLIHLSFSFNVAITSYFLTRLVCSSCKSIV